MHVLIPIWYTAQRQANTHIVAHLDMITALALIPFLQCLLVLPPWNSYVEATRWSLELNVSHWQLPNEWHDSTLIYIHHAGVIHFPRFQRQRSACHRMTIYDHCASKEGEVSSMQEARIDAVNVGWSLERFGKIPRYLGFQAEEEIHDNLRRGQELVRNSSQRQVALQKSLEVRKALFMYTFTLHYKDKRHYTNILDT